MIVPQKSLEAYKSTKPWSDFGTITSIETTGIESIIDNTESPEYYNINGIRIANIDTVQKGQILIMKQGNNTKKIIVK